MSSESNSTYRQGAALLFTLAAFLLVVYALEKTGAGRGYGIIASAIVLAGLWLVPSMQCGTTKASRFLKNDNHVRAGINALAIAALSIPPFLAIDSGGLFFRAPEGLLIFSGAILLGLAGAALFVAGPLRASGATDLSDLVAGAYETPTPARLLSLLLFAAGLLLAMVGLETASFLAGWFFAIDRNIAAFVTAAAVALPIIMGGLAPVIAICALAMAALLVGLNLPLIIHAINAGGLPIGQLTFGHSAIEPLQNLETRLAEVGIPTLDDVLVSASPITNFDHVGLFAAGLVVASAIAFSPFVNQFHVSATTPNRSGAAGIQAILIAGFAMVSLVALMAFTHYGIYQFLLGLPIDEARYTLPVLHEWSGRNVDLVRLCGSQASSAEMLSAICGNEPNRLITISDLQIDSRLLLAGAPDLTGQPLAMTAVVTISLILMSAASTSAILLAVSGNVMSAFYMTLSGKLESGRVFLIRFLSLALAMVISSLVTGYDADFTALALLGAGLIASTAPVAVTASLNPTIFGPTMLSLAMTAGAGTTLGLFALSHFGIDLAVGTGDEWSVYWLAGGGPLAPALTGVFGLITSFAVLVAKPLFDFFMQNLARKEQQDTST